MPDNSFLKVIFFLLLFVYALTSEAQVKETRFTDWVQEMEEKYNVSFSYNHTLMDELRINDLSPCSDLTQCMQVVAKAAPLSFESVSTSEFLVLPVRAEATFTVEDQETAEPVQILRIGINDQAEFYLLPQNGAYKVPNLFPTDSLVIHSRFYSSIQVQASTLLSDNPILRMAPDTVYLQEVVIQDYLSSGVDSKLSDHSMEVDMTDLGLLAGETDGDILNILKNFPGVRTPDGKPGSLNFRGSTPDQTLIYFDQIPIYHQGHFFGTISPYNPAAVSRIKIHRGTMPSRWGGRVGGLIDLQTSSVLPDESSYNLAMNTIYAGANVDIPVGEKLGISLGARTDYPGDYLPPKLEAFRTLNFQGSRVDPSRVGGPNQLNRFDVQFQDFNGKMIWQINDSNRATFSFLNIQNQFGYTLISDMPNPGMPGPGMTGQREVQQSDLDNWGLTAGWNGKLSERLSTDVSLTMSSFNVFEQNEIRQQNRRTAIDEVFNEIRDQRAVVSAEYRISDQSLLEFGYQYASHKVKLDEIREVNMPQMTRKDDAEIHSVYLSTQQHFNNRIVATLGLRSDYYSPLGKRYYDPRVSLSYMSSDFLFLKGSAGISHQYISQELRSDFDDFRLQNQFWSLSDSRTPVLESAQGMIGVLYDRYGWLVDLELYKKKTEGVRRQISPMMNENGSLESKGADLFIKKRWTQFEAWAGYSLSQTHTRFDQLETAYFDQRHILNLTFLLRRNRWNYAITWAYLSGMPVIVPELDPALPGSNGQTTLSVPYSDNFPAQHQLDISVTWKFWKKAEQWRGVIGLSFLNIYDRQNTINIFQNNPRVDQPFRYAVGFAPNLNVRVRL